MQACGWGNARGRFVAELGGPDDVPAAREDLRKPLGSRRYRLVAIEVDADRHWPALGDLLQRCRKHGIAQWPPVLGNIEFANAYDQNGLAFNHILLSKLDEEIVGEQLQPFDGADRPQARDGGEGNGANHER